MQTKKVSGVVSAIKKVRGGVKVSHNKNTAELETVRIPTPEKVTISMQQHIGAPCTPLVKKGDTVDVGQPIGDSESYVSAPIHASISGTVSDICDIKLPNGVVTKAVVIESDGEMRQHDSIQPPKVETKEDFINAIRKSGLVGLGGAGFPTHIKLTIPPDKNIDTLVVNAAECEPFITVDYRECLENSYSILESIQIIKQFLDIKNIIIAIEDNKPEALKVMKNIADKFNDNSVKVMTLKSKYPQGAEKMMVQSTTGRKIPPGKLPSDVGCIVMNVASVAFISRYFKTGRPLISRTLTIDGSAIKNPKNVRVPIGTDIGEIVEFCGGFTEEPYKILTGGPMMGFAIVDTNLPTLKQNNAILAFNSKKTPIKKELACIRCGQCVEVCPMSLMPTLISRFAKAKNAEQLEKVGVNVCMECGSCAYACPAGKPLVQYMRLAKSVLREANQK